MRLERETGTWESWLRPSGILALGFPQLLQSVAAAKPEQSAWGGAWGAAAPRVRSRLPRVWRPGSLRPACSTGLPI